MKKLIYLLFMPLFIFISIVGTGFSTWYFLDDTFVTKSATIPVSIEQYVDVGEIDFVDANGKVIDTKQNPYKLVIDQKRVALNERIKVRYTLSNTNNIIDKSKIKFICNITLSPELTKYIQINSPDVTKEMQDYGEYQMSWLDNFTGEVETLHTSNLFFEYKVDAFSGDETIYEKIYNELIDGTISITYKAILEKTAA